MQWIETSHLEKKCEVKRGSCQDTCSICRGISSWFIRLKYDNGPHNIIVLVNFVFSCPSLYSNIIRNHLIQFMGKDKGVYSSVDTTLPWMDSVVNWSPPAGTCFLLLSPLLGQLFYLFVFFKLSCSYMLDGIHLPATFCLAISAKTLRES